MAAGQANRRINIYRMISKIYLLQRWLQVKQNRIARKTEFRNKSQKISTQNLDFFKILSRFYDFKLFRNFFIVDCSATLEYTRAR